jgi:proteasome lid subunit RPN8/RPN11
MRVFDEVLRAVDQHIAQYEPERGGLLFGPIGRDVVALLVPDDRAMTSSVTYTISREMCDRAPQIERETNLEYKGVIHSHPASLDHPSHGDHSSAANALRLNPHMGRFFMPIVTHYRGKPDGLRSHEVMLHTARVGAFVATRRSVSGSDVDVRETPLYSIPLRSCLETTCNRLTTGSIFRKATLASAATRIFNEGVMSLAYTISCDGHDYIIMAGELFPQYAPHILCSDAAGDARAIPVTWSINCDPVDCIMLSIRNSLVHDKPIGVFSRFRQGSKRWKREQKRLNRKSSQKK